MRKILKAVGILASLLLITGAAAYLWVLAHARTLLEEYVHRTSGGSVTLRMESIRYRHRSLELTLNGPEISSTDSTRASTSYRIGSKTIRLGIGSIWRMVTGGKIDLRHIHAENPVVEVTKHRPGTRKDFSIPDEMSVVYGFLEEALQDLRIRRLTVEDGAFVIRKSYDRAARPVRIDRIRMLVEGLQRDEGKSDDRLFYSDRILLETRDQDIVFGNGLHGIAFRRFFLNTAGRTIGMDSCRIRGRRRPGSYGAFDISLDSIRLLGTDLGLLAREDIIKTDSVILQDPDIRFNLELRKRPGGRRADSEAGARDSAIAAFRELTGDMDIGFIGVQGADIEVTALRNGGESRYSARKSDFTIRRLRILDDPERPIRVGRFDIAIKDYIGYSADSLYAVRFDSIQLVDDNLSLNNFSIAATPRNHDATWREVRMRAFGLEDVYWSELFFNNRLRATDARLLQPSVQLDLSAAPDRRARPEGSLYRTLQGFRDRLQMDNLYLADASLSIRSADNATLRMDRFNTVIDVGRFLRSGNETDLVGSLNGFTFASGSLTGATEDITLREGRYARVGERLSIARAEYANRSEPLRITAEGMVLTGAGRTPDNRFQARDVSWQKADIVMRRSPSGPRTLPEGKPLLIGWERTFGRDTRLTLENGETRIATLIRSLQTGAILIPTIGKPRINGSLLEGGELTFIQPGLRADVGAYRIADEKTSTLSEVRLELALRTGSARVAAPALSLVPDLESIIESKPTLSRVYVESPRLAFVAGAASRLQRPREGAGTFTIGELEIRDAAWKGFEALLPEGTTVGFGLPHARVQGIRANSRGLQFASLAAAVSQPCYADAHLSLQAAGEGYLHLALSNAILTSRDNRSGEGWKVMLDSLTAPALRAEAASPRDGKDTPWHLRGIALRRLPLSSGMRWDPASLLTGASAPEADVAALQHRTRKLDVAAKGIRLRGDRQQLSMDSLRLAPLLSREEFVRTLTHQQDHLQFRSGPLAVEGLDIPLLLRDSLLRIRSLAADNALLEVYKDRTLPFLHGRTKPMPAEALGRLPIRASVDSLRLRNATVRYEERMEEGGRSAVVGLPHTEALLLNLHNGPHPPDDSLEIRADTRLLDTADIRIRYRQSYADSLGGFTMALRTGGFRMPSLNGILEPLASLRMSGGRIDTLTMLATGDDFRAWGRMRMYYRDLRLQILNREDFSKKTPVTRLLNFVANALLLRNGNLRRTGTIAVFRDRERSVFNFWNRMTLNGMITSAGIRAKNRQQRRYLKTVRNKPLPELPISPLR